MRRAPWQLAAVAVAVAVIASACGGDGGGDAAPTSTTAPTTTDAPTSSTSQPSAPAACPTVEVPDAATDLTEAEGDVDGDGAADGLRSYRSGDGWHLAVDLAAGGGADTAVVTFDEIGVSVVGGADVDGDGGDEVWARTGAGASATILGLARLVDCQLVRVTFAGDQPAELPVGGSVGTTTGLHCEAQVDPAADLTAYTATNTGDTTYDVTATEYALEGTVLVAGSQTTSPATVGDDLFARATTFTCEDLSL